MAACHYAASLDHFTHRHTTPSTIRKKSMQKKIDIKSMVIGAALGAAIMLSVAAASTQTASGGRYQLVVADGYALKIDTSTGQIWRTFLTKPEPDFMAANSGK